MMVEPFGGAAGTGLPVAGVAGEMDGWMKDCIKGWVDGQGALRGKKNALVHLTLEITNSARKEEKKQPRNIEYGDTAKQNESYFVSLPTGLSLDLQSIGDSSATAEK